jgi:cell division protein FtsB
VTVSATTGTALRADTTNPAVPRRGATPRTSAERRHLEVVRSRRRVRTGVFTSVVVTVVFAALLGLAAMQAVLVQGQLELDRIDSDIANLEQQRDRLESTLAGLESPDQITARARAEGMVSPPEVITLTAETGQ